MALTFPMTYEHNISDIDQSIADTFDTDSLVALSDLSNLSDLEDLSDGELEYHEPVNMGPVTQKYIQEKETEAKEATDACVAFEQEVEQLKMKVFDHEQTIDCRDHEIRELKKKINQNPQEPEETRCDNCLDCISPNHDYSECVYWCDNHTAITKHFCVECEPHSKQRVYKLMDWYSEVDENVHDDRTVFRMYFGGNSTGKAYTLSELKDWKSGVAAPTPVAPAAPAPAAPAAPSRKRKVDDTVSKPERTQTATPTAWRRRVTTRKRTKNPYNTQAFDLCPWCPYRGSEQKRSLMEHICGGNRSCAVPMDQRVNTTVVNDNSFTKVGQSGYEALKNLGFVDPRNFIREYMDKCGGQCTHCDKEFISTRKMKKHINSVHMKKQTSKAV